MRSDFERGAYNVHEHNHTEWEDKKLFEEENLPIEPWHVGERLQQRLGRQARARFELDSRYPTTDEAIRRGTK